MNIHDRMEAQREEFDAADMFAKQLRRLGSTPVVDDEYPEVRHAYEGALASFIEAMKANGRFEKGNRYALAQPGGAAHIGEDGVALIATERSRQIESEGWTPAHDDEHTTGELATAAACYAAPGQAWVERGASRPRAAIIAHWPWPLKWWKPCDDDRVRELVKAGALIAAEIDRLQRAAVPTAGGAV